MHHHSLFAFIARAIPTPRTLTIIGLIESAGLTVAKIREKRSRFPDLVCGFDQSRDLEGLMVEDADHRQAFQALFFAYGFSIEFNDMLEGKIRVWIGDDQEWIGSDEQALKLSRALAERRKGLCN